MKQVDPNPDFIIWTGDSVRSRICRPILAKITFRRYHTISIILQSNITQKIWSKLVRFFSVFVSLSSLLFWSRIFVDVSAGIELVLNITRQFFPNTPFYPALGTESVIFLPPFSSLRSWIGPGNHDNYLSDQLPPPPRSAPWLSFIASCAFLTLFLLRSVWCAI